MFPSKPEKNQCDLIRLRELFDIAIASGPDECQQIVEQTRLTSPQMADRLDAMLQMDLETTISTQVTHTPKPNAHGKSIDGYEILEEIGHGGMGVVYRARQLHPERIVALKMIRVGVWASKSDIQRFDVEIRAIAKLEHPNIVPIYEIGEQAGEHFYTMQFIHGGRFDEYLESEHFDRSDGLKMFLQICEAAAYCHEQGVVHRDLKPSNILLDRMIPKITDFGLAKELGFESSITRTGILWGRLDTLLRNRPRTMRIG